MKKVVLAVFFAFLGLAFAQQDHTLLIAERPLATPPSVLRGDWSGTIFNLPENKNSTLELTGITAECISDSAIDVTEDRCYRYTFKGNVSLDGSPSVPISGEGYAGDYFYTLTSSAEPVMPQIHAQFELGESRWRFAAHYPSSNALNSGGKLVFEGSISSDKTSGRSNSLLLEPTTP